MSVCDWVVVAIAALIVIVSLLGLWHIAQQMEESRKRADALEALAAKLWGDRQ